VPLTVAAPSFNNALKAISLPQILYDAGVKDETIRLYNTKTGTDPFTVTADAAIACDAANEF
jgi:hypothetical protein